MIRPAAILIAVLAATVVRSSAQDLRREVRPELDVYWSQGSRIRFIFRDELQQGVGTQYTRGSFEFLTEVALRPVFRRPLRHDDDTFRQRYLTARAGYQHLTSFVTSQKSAENRAVVEINARYPLPGGFVIQSRNRADLRFIEGQSFSARYRHRLWIERDVKIKTLVFTPYIYDEIFFDTRFHAWSANRVAAGVQFPLTKRVVAEPYVLAQRNYYGSPSRTQALGFKLSLFF